MITTIEVTHDTLHILTGIGAEKHAYDIRRKPTSQTWEWHERVASAIADHHASMMGRAYPCPEPTVPTNPKQSWLKKRGFVVTRSLELTQDVSAPPEPDYHSDPGNFVMPSWIPSNEELDEIEAMPDMCPMCEQPFPMEEVACPNCLLETIPTHWDGPDA